MNGSNDMKEFEDVKCPKCGGKIADEDWDDEFQSLVGWCLNCLETENQVYYVQSENKFYEINENNETRELAVT